MNTILVPTDFSDNANHALDYAIAIAERTNAKIRLVNCYHVPYSTATLAAYKIDDALKIGSTSGLEELKSNLLSEHPQLKVEIDSHRGDLVNYLTKDYDQSQLSLIVMGTKGNSNVENVILGSTTTQILSKVDVPVMAIPQKAVYKTIRKIVYASDYQEEGINVIQKITQIAQLFDAEIEILHVIEKDESSFTEEVLFRGYTSIVKEKVPYTKLAFKKIIADDIKEGIRDYVKDNNADLLAMATHERSFFAKLLVPSWTKSITVHSDIPILSFKVEW